MKIVIIGAGFSGLASAYLIEGLLGPEIDLRILEGSGRAGGRVATSRFASGLPYDAGCAELYDIAGSPWLRRLVRHLELSTTPMTATPYFVYRGHLLHREQDFRDRLGAGAVAALDHFWEVGKSLRPPEEYAQAGHPRENRHPWFVRRFRELLDDIPDPAARHFTEIQVHSDVATEPEHTHALFGFDNLLIDDPDYCRMYRIVGGNERLIEALRHRIAAPLLLNRRLESVESCGRRGCRIRCGRNGSDQQLWADVLILTPPPRHLERILWSGPELDQALSRHIRHHEHGTDYLRVSFHFRHPFWRESFPEDYFVADAFGGVTVYDQSRRDGAVLSWLLAGGAATRLVAASDEEVRQAVLDSFPRRLRGGLDLLLETAVDRWSGAWGVSRMPGGQPLLSFARRHRPYPGLPWLFLTGDYLYDATLCGALDSLIRVVLEVVARCAPHRNWGRQDIEALLGSGGAPPAPQLRSTGGRLPFLNCRHRVSTLSVAPAGASARASDPAAPRPPEGP